jgi:transcriptional regulator with XRE-family HTH domain
VSVTLPKVISGLSSKGHMERRELLRLRKAMQLTQAQMADLLRLPLETIKKLEAGTLDPPTSKKLVRMLIARDFWLSTQGAARAPGRRSGG